MDSFDKYETGQPLLLHFGVITDTMNPPDTHIRRDRTLALAAMDWGGGVVLHGNVMWREGEPVTYYVKVEIAVKHTPMLRSQILSFAHRLGTIWAPAEITWHLMPIVEAGAIVFTTHEVFHQRTGEAHG